MALSNDLISQFVKATKQPGHDNKETLVYGTVVEKGDKLYVKIDGSDMMTPASSTVNVKEGDRVTILLKNHSATVNGNISSPSASGDDVDKVTGDLGDSIVRIEKLEAQDVIISGELNAANANIEKLTAKDVEITGKLEATEAEIEKLEVSKLDVDIADIKYATIEKLEATDAFIRNLEADYGSFKDLTTDKFTANDAAIKDLEAEKLSATDADLKYATIDFANIGEAAIEKIFADSGIIKDLIVSGGHITGELVGVTIKGDLIEAGTVKADKLVVKGSDGLYYKLNLNGETVESEQTEYNSLNGSVITAKSITATKIAVDDLVAFDATIAGLHLTDGSIYSGVKGSVDNSTRGFYLDKLGQMSLGDADNFLKYYKDQNGAWRLAISAESIRLGSSGKDIEETIASTITSSEEEFYGSTSPVTLAGGSWSKSQPQWTEGIYIWRRTVVTYGDGAIKYTPSENGVCITGNTGVQGEKGDDAVVLQILSSNGNLFKNSSIATSLTVTIIVAGEMITSSKRMYEKFGLNATLTWYQKRFGETEFTKIEEDDNRMSDHGFILTINPQDIFTHTVFNCELNY